MESLALNKCRLERAAGLVVGIAIGIVLSPLIFTPLGVPIVAAASFGCAAGAVVGYLLASLLVYKQKAASRLCGAEGSGTAGHNSDPRARRPNHPRWIGCERGPKAGSGAGHVDHPWSP